MEKSQIGKHVAREEETDLEGAALDLLDADHVQRQVLIQQRDGVDNKLGEEGLLASNQLR